MQSFLSVVPLLFTILLVLLVPVTSRPTETERVELWHQNVKYWPPRWHEHNESAAYKAVQQAREEEIMSIPGSNERWENWMQFVQGRMVPKFTPMGFKVIKTPKWIHEKLINKVESAIEHWDDLPLEDDVGDAIYGPLSPKFVEMEGLDWYDPSTPLCPFSFPLLVLCPPWNTHSFISFLTYVYRDVIEELKELHEEWSGMKLVATSAYGMTLLAPLSFVLYPLSTL